MKKIVREFEFSPEAGEKVKQLAAELGLTQTTAGILFARGNDTAEKMRTFLHPSKEHFLSPFLMRGMKETVELLKRARDEEWRVAVFGDYDADGIGALAILGRALIEFGIQPYLYVPERADGYGMNVDAIDKIFDEFLPDLILTVDCGISNRKEVEYIKEQGAYVVVTDHHELPDELPDCIIINPKLKDDYPYDNLCGAGVAYKLASALIGDKALELLDFAALSTVADSVPLTGENRDIVAEGLKRMAEHPRPAIQRLIGKQTEITAQTLAFTVAPRINAAGRMGDAHAALKLFLSEDEDEIAALSEQLNEYNLGRQHDCDELFRLALSEIYGEGAYGNVVMLAGDAWNAGTVGIAAARLAERFHRPALLFVKHGGRLRGSARSVEGVNIFDALKACSEHIEEFGGHSQAAGVNVKADAFDALKRALDEYLGSHYAREVFEPVLYVCGSAEDYARVAHETAMLEPFGVGNRRPQFVIEADETNAAPMKPLSPHACLSLDRLDFVDFNAGNELKILKSDLHKQIVFEYNLSNFRGREYLKGFVRAVNYDAMSGTDVELDLLENRLRAFQAPQIECERMEEGELNALLEREIESSAYGLCAVCFNRKTLSLYPALQGVAPDVFSLSSGSVRNAVLIAPDLGCDLSAYRLVVFLDSPAAGVTTGKARVLAAKEQGEDLALDVSREGLLHLFSKLKSLEGTAVGECEADAARACSHGEDERNLVFALSVFRELGLVELAGGVLHVVRGVKTELANSAAYTAIVRLQEG